jgi:hypothetical protein
MVDDDSASAPKLPPPMDRASESVVNPPSVGRVQIVRGPMISSGEIEISPESFSPTAVSVPNPRSANQPPSSAANANANARKSVLPLTTLVAIGAGVFVVLVALALLLFR